ncbi:PaaI family thioesterase [Rhodopila sp.]|uniref:PaaI family thioesterase n=1 Tax=Rhodopila sp. TaxID=2480087 RepID=UPI003D0DA48A
MSSYDPAADGWRALPGAALPGGLGIPWARKQDGNWRYGLRTTAEHANPSGVVHGGVLMAFADHGLSFLAWEAAERAPCTTIQLNTHFLDGVRPGDFLELRGEVTRRTRGLVFLRGVAGVRNAGGTRDVVAVDGIWRVLQPR